MAWQEAIQMSLKSSVNNIADKNPFLQKDHNFLPKKTIIYL